MSTTAQYRYPEEIRDEFIASEDIVFRDGTRRSAEEIWQFMTKEAPVKNARPAPISWPTATGCWGWSSC
jgi:hypothetical protein